MNIHCFILYVLLYFVVFISLVYIILSAFALEGTQRWCQIFLAGIGCEIFHQATFDYRHMPVSLNIRYPKTPWVCHVQKKGQNSSLLDKFTSSHIPGQSIHLSCYTSIFLGNTSSIHTKQYYFSWCTFHDKAIKPPFFIGTSIVF